MNEFIAKKLGEVLAFAEVGKETCEKGRVAMEAAFGIERTAQITRDNTMHAETIRAIGKESGVLDIIEKKLAGTGSKLRAMRDLYIGDQWHNPTELLEWSGFFEGAAIVHWQLVLGAAETLGTLEESLVHNDLILLATSGTELHHGIFHEASTHLHHLGGEKANPHKVPNQTNGTLREKL